MTRINTNPTSLLSQRVLKKNNNNLNTSLERLSTGLKINRGSDDPAGLIASEILRGEKKGISTAIENAGRASNIIGTAEGGLAEVSSLLTELQGLVGQTANSGGLSAEERSANQLQVDSILGTINRIAGNTSFGGTKLLNGSFDYQAERGRDQRVRQHPGELGPAPGRGHPERHRHGHEQRDPGQAELQRVRARRDRDDAGDRRARTAPSRSASRPARRRPTSRRRSTR
jgi:hypothetical protein